MSTIAPPPEIQYLANYLFELVPSTLSSSSSDSHLRSLFTLGIIARFMPNHWYPLQPERGSGYRAISFDPNRHDGYLDPVLVSLSQLLGLSTRQLRRSITSHSPWTIWCDPGCVSIRSLTSGTELKELFGSLPCHLIHFTRPAPGTPSTNTLISRSPPRPPQALLCNPLASSSLKSRAIPILAPSSAAKLAGVSALAVTPPTPIQDRRLSSALDTDDEDEDQAELEHLARPFALASHQLSPNDPFFRPCSRTSSDSSSSDGSDHSAFSASSSSTATSISPALAINKKLCPARLPHAPPVTRPLEAGFIRHHSTSSLPFISLRPMTPLNLVSSQHRSISPHCPPVLTSKRRHGASASVSSLGGGRGLLVLKEGPGTVTEHSGGKVGVMGGGVLLGLPKDKDPSNTNKNLTSARRVVHRRARV